MSILKLTSDTLAGTPAAGNIEYNGQFFATDSNASRAQMQRFVQETAKTASGTSVDFTGIPAWAKRITVMFNGVSTNGSSSFLIQLGDSGGIETSGYSSMGMNHNTSTLGGATSTAGFIMAGGLVAANTYGGNCVICTLGSNIWTAFGGFSGSGGQGTLGSGNKTLSDVLDRVRITTVNGTDTFDAGSINIIYEG